MLYWFCHTLTWIRHGCTCIPKHEPPFHLLPHNISLGHPHAPAPSMLYPASDINCISALIFKSYFFLLTLGFSISSFSSCFRCRVRLFIWLFSCFLRYASIAMNFHLSTAFTVSHRFWVVVFSFSFVSMHILISFLISSVICWLFRSVLFNLHMLEFLIVFLL